MNRKPASEMPEMALLQLAPPFVDFLMEAAVFSA